MLQSYEVTSDPAAGVDRLTRLRGVLIAEGLDGFLVPRADAHQGEYVAARDERLGWLTGFTGSAGFCAALADVAGVFIDGRYRIQVREQVADVYTPVNWPEVQLGNWLQEHLPNGGIVGFDPWLYSVAQIEQLRSQLDDSGIEVRESRNLVDAIWEDQPEGPCEPVFAHPLEFAGESHADKRARLAEGLRTAGQAAALITLPDSIMWLLNIRGADIPRNPVAHGFAVLHADASVDLYMDAAKLGAVGDHLGDEVRVHAQGAFLGDVANLTGKIAADKGTLPVRVAEACTGELIWAGDPCVMPKACKNPVEIQGMVDAHLRDAVAMCEFLAWLDAQPLGDLSEIDVAIALERFRQKNPELLDLSFDTISASGPNAALPHYRVTRQSNRLLQTGEVMLVDSGGQYLDGTTDITRTVALGAQSKEVCDAFTRVLKGMIAISCLKFPKGTKGQEMDSHARAALWAAGQDFGHGTGHGVGQFLSVHEGPQRISRADGPAFQVGMMVSNEPGFYKEGSFGIRTENLLLVQEASFDHTDQFLEFETLTYVPIDTRMIVKNLLTPSEIVWINHYHELCLNLHKDNVSPQTAAWLQEVTKPI